MKADSEGMGWRVPAMLMARAGMCGVRARCGVLFLIEMAEPPKISEAAELYVECAAKAMGWVFVIERSRRQINSEY